METVDQFMARFRATGLDMITEARRRELDLMPQVLFWGHSESRWSMPGPNLQQVSKFFDPLGLDFNTFPRLNQEPPADWTVSGTGRVVRDDRWPRMIMAYPPLSNDWLYRMYKQADPHWRLLTIDSGEIIRNMPAWPDPFPEQAVSRIRERMAVPGRRLGQQMLSLAAAFAFAASSLGTAFDGETSWPAEVEPYEPPGRSLGPGKEVKEASHRGYDPKRIARDRLKKKLARKSRRGK